MYAFINKLHLLKSDIFVYSDTSLAISDFDSEGMILILIATLLADWLEGGGGYISEYGEVQAL